MNEHALNSCDTRKSPCADSVFIRRLRATDTAALSVFFERNNHPSVTDTFQPFPLTKVSAESVLNPNRKDLFFGLELNGELVGFSMLRGWDEGYETPSFGIVVDRRLQGRGLGHALTEWTLRWADHMDYARVRLTVFENNRSAVRLYQGLGFEETSRTTESGGRQRLVMHRSRRAPQAPNVFVSTQCLPSGAELWTHLREFFDAGLMNVELSNYPVSNEDGFATQAASFPGRLMLHHFFPRQEGDLALNLASADRGIVESTLAFFRRGLDWSAACGARYYSIHAGYASDPVGRDRHGFLFPLPSDAEVETAETRFFERLVDLAGMAAERNVTLLVENNVVSEHHRGKLLLSTPGEFERFLARWPESLPLGILLDWGHWRITACTMGLDLSGFAPLSEWIRGLHLHDNDGRQDMHLPFNEANAPCALWSIGAPDFITLEGHYNVWPSLQQSVLRMEKTCEGASFFACGNGGP